MKISEDQICKMHMPLEYIWASFHSCYVKGKTSEIVKMLPSWTERSKRDQLILCQRRWFTSYTSDKDITTAFHAFLLVLFPSGSSFPPFLRQLALHFCPQPSCHSSRRSLGVNQESHHTLNSYTTLCTSILLNRISEH